MEYTLTGCPIFWDHLIDQDFAQAMRSIGRKRPNEIDPNCANASNADIVLEADNVIVEVNTVIEDVGDKAHYQEKLSAMYAD